MNTFKWFFVIFDIITTQIIKFPIYFTLSLFNNFRYSRQMNIYLYYHSLLQVARMCSLQTQLFLNGKICLWSNIRTLFCVNEYEKILKCLLFLCILGFLNAWWPFEIRMWSSFRFICPVEKIRGRESIHNCEKHWKSICIFVLKTLAGWRERYIGREK